MIQDMPETGAPETIEMTSMDDVLVMANFPERGNGNGHKHPESEIDLAAPLSQNVEKLQEEVVYYKSKAIQQDIMIFEMRALLQSGKGLSNILNLKSLLETFMAVVREKYGAVSSTVLLKDDLDPSQEFYRIMAYYGLPDFYNHEQGHDEPLLMYKFPKDNGLLWQIIQQGNVFSVRDMQDGPRFQTAWQHWNLDVLGSIVWCPLIKSGEVLGILTLGPREDGSAIPEDQYPFLQELASIATTNIDSTLKYEKNIRILRNIQTLYDINQQIASVNDFKRLCIETLSTAVDALGAQKGNLMILNKDTQMLELKVVWGNIPVHVRDEINSGLKETKAFAIGEGVAGKCAKSRKPLRMNDRTQIEQFGEFTVFCIASVPIIYGNELEGVINMTNKIKIDDQGNRVLDPLGRFSEEDMALLLGLADQAAVNINKSRLYNASITDRLTSLYNARYFDQMLEEKFAEAKDQKKPMVLAIADIDYFKRFNDTAGHMMGDHILQVVAKIFGGCCRTNDMAFRYGGEEFCMIMPNTTPMEALELMEAFRQKVESSILVEKEKHPGVTVSVGLAVVPYDDVLTSKDLFELADESLYACKQNGRNQVRLCLKGRKMRYAEDIAEAISEVYPLPK